MSLEGNKAAIHRFYEELWNARRLIAEGGVNYDTGFQTPATDPATGGTTGNRQPEDGYKKELSWTARTSTLKNSASAQPASWPTAPSRTFALFLAVEALGVPLLTNPAPWLGRGGALAALVGVGLLVADVVLPVPPAP
jgi:hypothetical protein